MLGDNIKELRLNLKLSQAQFAEKLGVKQKAVSDWENGKFEPSIKTILQIHKKWNVSPNSLLLGDDSELEILFLDAKSLAAKNKNINKLKDILENYISQTKLSTISSKFRSIKGKEFIEKLAEYWHGKGHRMLIVLYYFIEHIQKKHIDCNIDISNKEKLIKELKSFKIPKKIQAKHLFAITQKDKENLISWVEKNLDEIDAASLLTDLPKLKEIVKEEINYPNKALL